MFRPLSLILTNIGTHKRTEYTFRQGQPTLIVGINVDDLSQKGNGSGKSGFMEGVAIAVTGSPVRDASNREMVRRGFDSGEVEFTIYNTMYACELKIWRKLYAGTKSAEVKIWENGEEVIVSDVKEYNRLIFDYLAISKEDFFNFYLLTQATYTPFFNTGDVKKKEIVNRFSGANKVDGVKEIVDADVAEAQKTVTAVQRLIDINSGKQEIISTQIIAEEEKYSEDSKFALAEERNEQLITLLDFVEKSTVWIEEAQSLIQIDEREEHALESILPGYAFDLAGKKAALVVDQEELDKLNAELPKIEAKFSKTQKTIADKKALLQESIPKIRASINEAEKIKADIEKQLHGVIECPACHHHFTIGDQTFTWEEANGELKDTTELIVDLTKDLQADEKALAETLTEEKELIQKIADAQKGQREKIKVKEAVVDQIHTDIRTIEADIRKDTNAKNALTDKVERARREVTKTEQLIEEKLKEAEDIEAAIAQIKDGKSDKLTEMEANLLTVVDEGSELQEKLQAAMDVVRKKEEWNTNFKNFKSFLANQSIKTIEDYTNMYLQKMGTNLSIAIQGYRLLSSKKLKEEISITVLRNGLEEASYGTFSGGERARIDIAVILSIQELINLNSTSGGIDLLFIDEVLDSVDSLGMQHIIEGLKNVGKTVLIVSQVEINSLAEDTLIIQKKDKISRII